MHVLNCQFVIATNLSYASARRERLSRNFAYDLVKARMSEGTKFEDTLCANILSTIVCMKLKRDAINRRKRLHVIKFYTIRYKRGDRFVKLYTTVIL